MVVFNALFESVSIYLKKMARFINLFDKEERKTKIYKTRKNILTTMSDDDLYKRLRFDKEAIKVRFLAVGS